MFDRESRRRNAKAISKQQKQQSVPAPGEERLPGDVRWYLLAHLAALENYDLCTMHSQSAAR